MKLSKLLILLIFFGGIAVAQEEAPEYMNKSNGVITNVITSFVFYKDHEALQAAFPEQGPIEGISFCLREIQVNMAWCTIHVVEPYIVDGENTLTAGHEVYHGVYGVKFHK